MAQVFVDFVERATDRSQRTRVVGLAGRGVGAGGDWYLNLDQVLGDLRRGLNEFVVRAGQASVTVRTARGSDGEPSLIAKLPGSPQDLLEMLPEVPDALLRPRQG